MFQADVTGNKYIISVIAGLLAAVLISGCGHRGDLRLPDATDTANQTEKQKKKQANGSF